MPTKKACRWMGADDTTSCCNRDASDCSQPIADPALNYHDAPDLYCWGDYDMFCAATDHFSAASCAVLDRGTSAFNAAAASASSAFEDCMTSNCANGAGVQCTRSYFGSAGGGCNRETDWDHRDPIAYELVDVAVVEPSGATFVARAPCSSVNASTFCPGNTSCVVFNRSTSITTAWSLKGGSNLIPCAGSVCDAAVDNRTCCESMDIQSDFNETSQFGRSLIANSANCTNPPVGLGLGGDVGG